MKAYKELIEEYIDFLLTNSKPEAPVWNIEAIRSIVSRLVEKRKGKYLVSLWILGDNQRRALSSMTSFRTI